MKIDYIIKPMTYNDLCKIPGLKKLKEKLICGIYFLVLNKTVVYVGQSTNIIARSHSHKDKIFNRILYIECEKESLNKMEIHYIIAFNPEYNKTNEYEKYIYSQIPKDVLEKKRIKEQKRKNKEHMEKCKKNLAKMYKERIAQIEGQPYKGY